MKKLLNNECYEQISDPYGHNRICFKATHISREDMVALIADEKFMFIANNIVYFDK